MVVFQTESLAVCLAVYLIMYRITVIIKRLMTAYNTCHLFVFTEC